LKLPFTVSLEHREGMMSTTRPAKTSRGLRLSTAALDMAQLMKNDGKSTPVLDDELIRPAVGTLSRTKSLLLAALKVWELKNGIDD
jgi:hypothetical protein